MKKIYLIHINLSILFLSSAAICSQVLPKVLSCVRECTPKENCDRVIVAGRCAKLCSKAISPKLVETLNYCKAKAVKPPPLPRDTAPSGTGTAAPTSTPTTASIDELTNSLFDFFNDRYNLRYLDDIGSEKRFEITKELTRRIVRLVSKNKSDDNNNMIARSIIQTIKGYIADNELNFPEKDPDLAKLQDIVISKIHDIRPEANQ